MKETQTETKPRSAVELLGLACEWRLLGALLARPTDARRREVRTLAREIENLALFEVAESWLRNATEGTYLALFGPGGAVAARVVAYRTFADPGWILSDIVRYHDAFGFHPVSDGGIEDPIDHAAVLCEFVAYLFLKEAYASDAGDPEAAEVTAAARRKFIEEHLAPVALPMAEKLSAVGADDWAAVAHVLARRVPAPPSLPQGGADPFAECNFCRGVGADQGEGMAGR